MFKNNLIPMAVKNRSKSVEEVKEWRLADKVFEADDIAKPLAEVFAYFSTKTGALLGGRKDETLKFSELVDMLKRAKLLEEGQPDDAKVSMKQVIYAVERYYDPKGTLRAKLSDEEFEAHLEKNPMLLKAN